MSVRRVPPSLAISVGVHLVLGVSWWAVGTGEDERRPTEPAVPVIGLEASRSEVVEVVMLDAAAIEALTPAPPPTPSLVPPRPPPPRPARVPATRVASSASTTREPTPAPAPAATSRSLPAPPAPLLDLRKGRDLAGRGRGPLITTPSLERIALGGGEPSRSVIETRGAGGAVAIVDARPRESIVTASITPGGRGGYKIDDLVFDGRIEADGSVSLKDKRNVQHQFKSWKHVKKVLREAGPLGLLRVDFDITDAMMRRKKIDPYASRKLALLDQTRDARVELGTEYRKQVLARTSEYVRQNLEVAWAAVTDPAARKQALFEMWDEVDETGDEELVAAGTAARAAIVGFIRARLPAGRAGAFTSDELAAFNRKRKSRQAFAPYG